MTDDNDVDASEEELTLSPSTLAALQEFYAEKEQRENRLKDLAKVKDPASNYDVDFEEDWQLSQFWYDEKTIEDLVRVAAKATEAGAKIALISCPTLFGKLKKECADRQVTLFEYDPRFVVYGSDFVLYDYKSPLNVPKEMSGSFDLVLADPPFLSEECLTKVAVTIKFLSKKNIVLCTGAVMADLAERLLDLKKCKFQPQHKNNLANEFCCYSNFNLDELVEKTN